MVRCDQGIGQISSNSEASQCYTFLVTSRARFSCYGVEITQYRTRTQLICVLNIQYICLTSEYGVHIQN